MKTKKAPLFLTEAALCAQFLSKLPDGWVAYPETAGWDILLVRGDDGFQIGIQAKLKLNTEVFSQAAESGSSYAVTSPGPDCRAVMVPASETGYGWAKIASHIGITILRVYGPDDRAFKGRFDPLLPKISGDHHWREEWFELAPTKRHKLPEYVPDVAAGASAPVQLTDWKIAALKMVITLERRGFVTREDFKHLGIDHRRWLSGGWLRVDDGRFVVDQMPNFKAQHPRVYAEIAADAEKWMRVDSGTLFAPAPELNLGAPA